MKLDAYLKERGETEDEFAGRAGIGRATVFRIKNRGARTAAIIAKVVAACEGKVSANDLVVGGQTKGRRQRRRGAA